MKIILSSLLLIFALSPSVSAQNVSRSIPPAALPEYLASARARFIAQTPQLPRPVFTRALNLQGATSSSGYIELPQGGERDAPAAGNIRLFNNGNDLQLRLSSGTTYVLTNPVRNQFQFVQGGSLALDGYVQGQRGNFGNLSSSPYSAVDRATTINIPATEDSNASVQITAPTTGSKPLVLQLKSGQTANGLEVQDSTGAVLASFDASGNVTAKNIKRGTGSPEGAVVGAVGDLYTRTDGGSGSTLYVKESGTGDTGWVAK